MELYCSLILGFGILMYRIGGRLRSYGRQYIVEPTLGYHSKSTGTLTRGRESGLGTMSGGQFDWGGRLPKE